MNIKQIDDQTELVTLSRRNLNTLLLMLDQNVAEPTLKRLCKDGRVLLVKVEEDVEHYASEDRQASVRNQPGVGPEDVRMMWRRS